MENKIDFWINTEENFDYFYEGYKNNNLYYLLSKVSKISLYKRIIQTFSKKNDFILEYKKYLANSVLIPDFEHIAATYTNGEEYFSGVSEDRSIKHAKFIAICELIERMSYKISRKNLVFNRTFDIKNNRITNKKITPMSTNGMAIYTHPKKVVEKSIFEAIERDSYLCHWYTNIRPKQISLPNNECFNKIKAITESLALKLSVFLLNSIVPEVNIVLITIVDPKKRFKTTMFCSGIASSYSIYRAFEKATKELNRFVSLSYQLKNDVLKIEDNLTSVMGRYYFYQKPDNEKLLKVFIGDGKVTQIYSDKCENMSVESLLDRIKSDVFIYPTLIPRNLKNYLFSSYAYIPILQQLDYETNPLLNHKRLDNFTNNTTKLNKGFHPLP